MYRKLMHPAPTSQWVSEKYFPEGFDLWDIFFPSEYVVIAPFAPDRSD